MHGINLAIESTELRDAMFRGVLQPEKWYERRAWRKRVVLQVTWRIQAAIVGVDHRPKSRVEPPLTKTGRWIHRAARCRVS